MPLTHTLAISGPVHAPDGLARFASLRGAELHFEGPGGPELRIAGEVDDAEIRLPPVKASSAPPSAAVLPPTSRPPLSRNAHDGVITLEMTCGVRDTILLLPDDGTPFRLQVAGHSHGLWLDGHWIEAGGPQLDWRSPGARDDGAHYRIRVSGDALDLVVARDR